MATVFDTARLDFMVIGLAYGNLGYINTPHVE
jgi:hypothetical protein